MTNYMLWIGIIVAAILVVKLRNFIETLNYSYNTFLMQKWHKIGVILALVAGVPMSIYLAQWSWEIPIFWPEHVHIFKPFDKGPAQVLNGTAWVIFRCALFGLVLIISLSPIILLWIAPCIVGMRKYNTWANNKIEYIRTDITQRFHSKKITDKGRFFYPEKLIDAYDIGWYEFSSSDRQVIESVCEEHDAAVQKNEKEQEQKHQTKTTPEHKEAAREDKDWTYRVEPTGGH